MEKNICAECGTENEAEYLYCKNCGAVLKRSNTSAEEKTNEKTENYAYTSQTQNTYSSNVNSSQGDYIVNSINGIPKEEISIFIGQKAFKIMPKFSKMELAQTKVSWCWPAAVLGFLFGPLGAAFWFFYRKMYKPAVVLSVIGAVLTLITTIMTLGTSSVDMEAFLNAFSEGDFNAAINSVDTSTSILTMVAELIDNAASIGSGILCGLFGLYLYKEHCVNKIYAFRNVQADQRYYRLGLASVGGVSGGMLALGILIMLGVNYAANFIVTIAAMLN